MSSSWKPKNNRFIDSTGIMHNRGLLSSLLFPIGYVYISVSNVNPGTLFGGTWTQITGRFLYCTTTSKTTGGEATHTLTIDEMPSHDHYHGCGNLWNWGSGGDRFLIGSANGYTLGIPDGHITGGGLSHNNMPPYFTVYAWYRTA